MPDLLLELFSEEIPARMQARAAEDLRKAVTDRLVDAGLVYEGAKAFVTPRRLALAVQGVPVRQPDRREEKKGPRVGAPERAVAGFLKAAGLKSLAEAKVQPDKKGDFYVAVIEKPGRAALDVISEILPEVIKTFPWPKSMRWGVQSKNPGALNWVRPLHSILATFGPETEDPDVVPFTIDGIAAGNATRGHRFLAPESFTARRLADYAAKLDKAKVVLDPERRRSIIQTEAKQLAFAQGLELVEDEGLLAETAGLVEWPVVLMGAFDEAFLHIPEEVIRATIRNNQKCFVLRDAAHAKLVDKFLLVANLEAEDGGKATALSALSDWLRRWRRWLAPTQKKQNGPRGCVKRTCSRKSSANFPNCKARSGNITRKNRARTKLSPTPSRIITGRRARTISCPAIRSRLRWRSPTSSIPWSASGPSTRNRPAVRIPTRCAGRHWGSSGSCLITRSGFH